MNKKILAIISIILLLMVVMTTLLINNGILKNSEYKNRYMQLYKDLHNEKSGYFSDLGIPYHSIETLICEAPDYGHLTTSEAMSYYAWLEAYYGKLTGDFGGFEEAWRIIDKYMIPSVKDQPALISYKEGKPASYVPEFEDPSMTPAKIDYLVAVGYDPINAGLVEAHGYGQMYGMHWLLDVDNWYGYGVRGDGVSKPSFINTYQRGMEESVWETVPHPSWEAFKWGGKNGFLDIFIDDESYAKQWRYSVSSDADARLIQATYWALKWAEEEDVKLDKIAKKASKLGDYLRYSFFDKYFKKIGCQDIEARGDGYDSAHYLIGWYYGWGGGIEGAWNWKIGSSHSHFGYQNPLTAWALSNDPELKTRTSNSVDDWKKSLTRQLEYLQWLQSSEGAIAGGATNSWNGRYEKYPEGTATFYGLAYLENPVAVDPGSNTWFGFQAWTMQRVAEYYYETGDKMAEVVLKKWVEWIKNSVNLDKKKNDFTIPSTLDWEGQPESWNGSYVNNENLHVKIVDYGRDLGITASLANALIYYSAASKKWDKFDSGACTMGKDLLDIMWKNYRDDKGVSVSEKRDDYRKFFEAPIYIPEGWKGKMANGDIIKPGIKFIDIRSKYKDDPDWAKLENAYKNNKSPEFNYHRFWAQCDIAIANATYYLLFEKK